MAMVLNRLVLVLAASLPCAASPPLQVSGPEPKPSPTPGAAGEFDRLSALQKGARGPLGWRAGVPAPALFERIHALAAQGHGPALAWCARHLDSAPEELALDPAFGVDLFVRLVRDHGSEAWLLDARHDPLRSLTRAPDGVRTAVEPALALEAPGEPLGLLLRAAALAPRVHLESPDGARALDLLQTLSVRAPLEPSVSSLEQTWRARAEALSWRIEHLSPGQCAPELAVRDVDGNELRLSDWLGASVLVDVWSSEEPDLAARVEHRRALLERFRGRAFALIWVGLDWDEGTFRRGLEELDLTWPTSYEGSLDGPAARAWHLDGGPTTVLVDPTGRVNALGLEGAELEQAIARLLESPEPSSTTSQAASGPALPPR